jgi:sulfite exporter TauE/SafE
MKSKGSLWQYHLGRMVSYVLLGFVAGALGNFFLNNEFLILRKISALLLAAGLIYAALSLILPERLKGVGSFSERIHKWILQAGPVSKPWLKGSGWVVGFLTAFLPCGWLYTYVAAALATNSPIAGGVVMFLFWMGGLPALSAIPSAMVQLVNAAPRKRQQVAGFVLLAAGLYSLVIFFWHSL